jgi:hypothetical protein
LLLHAKTQEFADLARRTIRTKMPALLSRIHRPTDLTEDDHLLMDDSSVDVHWSWQEAEARMRAAFAEGGLSRWIQVAMSELEREASMERLKRVDKYPNSKPDKTSP